MAYWVIRDKSRRTRIPTLGSATPLTDCISFAFTSALELSEFSTARWSISTSMGEPGLVAEGMSPGVSTSPVAYHQVSVGRSGVWRSHTLAGVSTAPIVPISLLC